MKEPYDEDLASHIGPESCSGDSDGMAEALTGVRAGRAWSREMLAYSRVPTEWVSRKAIPAVLLSQDTGGPCAVEDLGMYGNTLHGNRETPCPPMGEGAWAALGSLRT
jgi:hypothetical protein